MVQNYKKTENVKSKKAIVMSESEDEDEEEDMFESKMTLQEFINQDKKFFTLNLFIQTAFCGGQTLKEYLSQRKQIDFDVNLYLFEQLVLGVATIHKKDLIHRDLKPENIFFDENNIIKIGDFGLAREITTP